jgi:hypothetical protein
LGDPPNGVEPFLGNDRNPLVAILGHNPGLNGTPHPIGPPTNDAEMHQALDYFRRYLQGRDFARHEFGTVWRRYCWMLDPGAATYTDTQEAFTSRAPNQLLVLNLYQAQTTNVAAMTPQQRQGEGRVALELLDSARPKVLVVQGVDAWRWIRSHTQPVDGRRHLPYKLGKIYPGHAVGDIGYLILFREKRISELPVLPIGVLPVFHLTGGEQYPTKPQFADLKSRYRIELNRLFDKVSARRKGPSVAGVPRN